MKIGLLVCGHAVEEVAKTKGDYDDWFKELLAGNGFDFETYNVVDMDFPNDVHDCNGWLLSGSRHGAYEDHAFIPLLEDFVRKSYGVKIPMVGICFGHQLIAQALGGKVEKYHGGWAIGRQDYNFEGHGNVAINAWHQDQVTKLPKDARVIAGNDFCKNAAMVYGNTIFTMQPHPEFSNDVVQQYIPLRRDPAIYDDAVMNKALELTKGATGAAVMADDIAHFFKSARKGD